MAAGVHCAHFTHHKGGAHVGVVGPGFDPSAGAPAHESAQGWMLHMNSGRLCHAGANAHWEGQPLALELTDVVESPDGTDEDDDDFLAPRLELGLRYRDTDGEVLASLTSTVTGRLSLDADGDDHILQETVLAFPLDADGIASLNFAFKSGEEGPSFEGVRILTVGLGFKL